MAVLAALVGWLAVLPAVAETTEFTIRDERIAESSGLAADAADSRYWTVNDSGDSGIAYALDEEGETEGTLEFRADPVDVEAVAFHRGRLYVADIGDNGKRREFVTVYFFDDAAPATGPVSYMAYDFSYPDGAHDAETLLVDGSGRLFIVTKGVKAGIYAAPADPSRQGVNELKRVGDAPTLVTDGTVLPDGRYALRTYFSVEIVDPASYKVVARAAAPAQRQGESITTTFDGSALLLGSEGSRSKVLRVDIPTSVAEVSTPSASQSRTPSASPTATPTSPSPKPTATASASSADGDSEDAEDELTDTATGNGSPLSGAGTLAALGIAALVAVVAGVVVVIIRKD
ncbi:MAG: hypothetical protein QM650_16175 [Microlunatus sp.]